MFKEERGKFIMSKEWKNQHDQFPQTSHKSAD